MLSPDLLPIVVAGASIAIGGGIIAIYEWYSAHNSRKRKRLAAIAHIRHHHGQGATSQNGSLKQTIEDTLKQLEEKRRQGQGRRVSLALRLKRAGLTCSSRTYFMVNAIVACISYVILSITLDLGSLIPLGFSIACGIMLPHLYIGVRAKRRIDKFVKEFADSVDLIVRGLKSGLPLTDSIRMLAKDAPEPVKGEFRLVVEDLALGLSTEDAVQRLAERVSATEAAFFATVISLQSRTGGSLSEALGNLSNVMRERKKLAAKIKAMSSEAKASAGIIGSLPFAVSGLLSAVSPEYLTPLVTTFAGKAALVGCALWMILGILVMRKMIHFKF